MPASASKQGLLSRCIPVVHFSARQKGKAKEPGIDDDTIRDLARDLGDISKIRGEYDFAPGVLEVAQKWRDDDEPPLPTDPLMEEYNSRRFSHLIKMSMCYAAGRRNGLEIRMEDWESAQKLLFKTEENMPLILRRFSMSDAGKLADELVETVENSKRISVRKLKRIAIRTAKSMADVDKIIQVLVDSGAISRDDDLITPGTGL